MPSALSKCRQVARSSAAMAALTSTTSAALDGSSGSLTLPHLRTGSDLQQIKDRSENLLMQILLDYPISFLTLGGYELTLLDMIIRIYI